jgi:predicted secreted protein
MGTPWTQSIPTLSDAGTYTGQFFYIPGSAGIDGLSTGIEGHSFSSGLGYIYQNRQIRYWQSVDPDGTAQTFTAYITDYSITANVDKALILDITLRLTGFPVFI